MAVATSAPRRSRIVESVEHNLHHVRLPVVGEVVLPPPQRMVYYAGMGAMAAAGLIEWPLTVMIVAGHVLADQDIFGRLRGLGEAMESAA